MINCLFYLSWSRCFYLGLPPLLFEDLVLTGGRVVGGFVLPLGLLLICGGLVYTGGLVLITGLVLLGLVYTGG